MKQTATKAHAAGIITGLGTVLAAWVNGALTEDLLATFFTTLGVAVAGWLSAYFAINKPKA